MADILLDISAKDRGQIVTIRVVTVAQLIKRARMIATSHRASRITWEEAVAIIAPTYWPYAYEVHRASRIAYEDSLFPEAVRLAAHDLAYRYEQDKGTPKSCNLQGDCFVGWV